MVSASDLVIKSNDPKRERMLWTGVIIAFLVAAFFMFMLGQYTGGYSALQSSSQIKQLGDENASLKRSNDRLRQQLADVETAQTIDASSYESMQKTVTELESKLATQGKELRFYRQVIAPEEKVEGFHLLDPKVVKIPDSESFQLDMVVYQFNRVIKEVRGTVKLSITGEQNGTSQVYSLNNLLTNKDEQSTDFKFRYFQSFELRFVLPEGFEPNEFTIEVDSPIPGYKTITESYPWKDLVAAELS